MDKYKRKVITEACELQACDAGNMLNILWDIQDQLGCIDTESMQLVADITGTYRVVVEGVVSFYSFFSASPTGRIVIRLCDDIIDRFSGLPAIVTELRSQLGISPGQTTADGLFSLKYTSCIGFSDQAPAALINGQVVTRLTASKIPRLLGALRKHGRLPDDLLPPGDGNNASPLIRASVKNHIRHKGKVIFANHSPEAGLQAAMQFDSPAIIATVHASRLRGRGGAGFSIGKKLQLAAGVSAVDRVIICNADEGEPGTFKDRVLLTERADRMLEGMAICARAIGATQGILYLRAEYRYLENWLQDCLARRRRNGLLGQAILGQSGFDFDIHIQRGAGAYICGEESALIRSCEGARGEPTSRPPFPVEKGYKGLPTVVNNVETFCCIPPIFSEGPAWFTGIGTPQSTGTKLLSVSGDCARPGVYELPFGVTVANVLRRCRASDTACVVVGGASGQIIGPADFRRQLCFEDLPTAGAIMVFNSTRDVLSIVKAFTDFFVEESCGYCTPCRVGNVFLQQKLDKILQGLGEPADLDYLRELSDTIMQTSRCGLGHTSPNPILSTLRNFPQQYAALLKSHDDGRTAGFDLQRALQEARRITQPGLIAHDSDREIIHEIDHEIRREDEQNA